MKESSIYIDLSVYGTLKRYSYENDVSVCKIVKMLLRTACEIQNCCIVTGKLTEYQCRGNINGYKLFRYRLSDEDHKTFSSSRQRLEISISKLLLVGFLLFFENLRKETDVQGSLEFWYNYTTLKNYLFKTIIDFLILINYTIEKPPE